MHTEHDDIDDERLKPFSDRRLGRLARDARLRSGLSRDEAAARSGRFSAEALAALERGHFRAGAAELAELRRVYGIDPLALAPVRAPGFGALGEGWLHGGDHGIGVREALAAYLVAINAIRNTGPSTIFELRDQDLAWLRARLGLNETELLAELRSLVAAAGEGVLDGPDSSSGTPVVEVPAPVPVVQPQPSALLDPERAAELERIYDELYSPPPRWFGKQQHAERCEQLRARQQHLLEAVGCDSWTDYMLRISATPTEAA